MQKLFHSERPNILLLFTGWTNLIIIRSVFQMMFGTPILLPAASKNITNETFFLSKSTFMLQLEPTAAEKNRAARKGAHHKEMHLAPQGFVSIRKSAFSSWLRLWACQNDLMSSSNFSHYRRHHFYKGAHPGKKVFPAAAPCGRHLIYRWSIDTIVFEGLSRFNQQVRYSMCTPSPIFTCSYDTFAIEY